MDERDGVTTVRTDPGRPPVAVRTPHTVSGREKLVFALIASRTGSFDWPYLLVAGQLATCGVFTLWRRGWR